MPLFPADLTSDLTSIASNALYFDDFIVTDDTVANSTLVHGTQTNWDSHLAGTGTNLTPSTVGVNSTDFALGVMSIESGTTATGRCGMSLSLISLLFGYAALSTEWRIRAGTLASVAQNYNIYIGFQDNMDVVGEPVDGVYFKYDFDTSANWIITTANNSTRTNTTTTVAVSDTAFQKLRVEVNDTGTLATFYVGGVSVGTIATNIPTGAGRQFGLCIKIEKTAGTTNRQIYVDYVGLKCLYVTSR